MHTLASLHADISALDIPREATVLIHSSFKSLGPVAGGPETVIQAFEDYFEPGLLVMPTHTWAKVNTDQPLFDVVHTSSNVGILGELFRQRPGVIRSLHPTHSLAVKGEGAAEFVAGEHLSTTPTSREGCYGKLYDQGAYVVFLGVPLTRNTLIHGAEDWAGVTPRLADELRPLKTRTATGEIIDTPTRAHQSPMGDGISENYGKLEEPFLERGIGWKKQVGDAVTTVCQVTPMIDFTMALLADYPDVLLTPEPLERQMWESIS